MEGTVAITVTGGRISITGLEETISISVTGMWTQLVATIALLQAALLALRIIAISSFVFG
jgi:hypothetical protein